MDQPLFISFIEFLIVILLLIQSLILTFLFIKIWKVFRRFKWWFNNVFNIFLNKRIGPWEYHPKQRK